MTIRLADRWLDHPAADYPVTAAVVAGVMTANVTSLVIPSDRAVFFQTLTGVSGGLLGLGAIAVTVIFTVTPTRRLQLVLDVVGERLRWLIFSSLTGLVFTTAVALALFALDGSTHRVRLGATAACMTFMALRFGRLWWLFHLTLRTLVRRSPAGDVPEAWEAPRLGDDDYRLPRVSVRLERRMDVEENPEPS